MTRSMFLLWGCLMLLAGCGGGGGSSGSALAAPPAGGGNPPQASSDFDQGIFRDESVFKNLCANPRSGSQFPDRQGTSTDENYWLRSWSNDLYLWYDEIVDRDPALFTTPDYFDQMKTFASTPSGAPKDQFHFTYDTAVWEQLAQSGIAAGYGAIFSVLQGTAPREIIVAYVDPNGPAATASERLFRGNRILQIDGVDAVNGNTQAIVDTLNAGLFPDTAGETHTFVVEDFAGGNQRTVTLVSADVTNDPLPTSLLLPAAGTSTRPGYLLFNSHLATAEAALVDAIQFMSANAVTDLIVDMRYNGGGFLDIANELAYMIAGPLQSQGRVFDEMQFNDKHPATNPVTGQALVPDLFHTETQGFSVNAGQPLPSVNLPRVFVLTAAGTCSASEAVINGLRGIDVEVVLIGEPTCGKPYGFYGQDNCGTTYFSIQFRGANAKGFGDYADGFLPAANPAEPYELPGCLVADDFSEPLGSPQEALLAAALQYIETGTCPAGTSPNAAAGVAVRKRLEGSDEQPTLRSRPLMPGTFLR